MKIDTKFNRGDVVYYMSGNRICCSAIKEIEIHLSVDYKEEPAIIYKLFDGCHLVNPEILIDIQIIDDKKCANAKYIIRLRKE